MDIEIAREGAFPIVSVSGEVDHASALRLSEALDDASAGQSVLLLDFAGLRYIDSGGLSVVLRHMTRLQSTGWMGIINPSPNVMTLLTVVVAPGSSLRFFHDREGAIKAAAAA